MVLIALVPLLTSTLGSLLAETAAGKLAGFGSDKGKSAINKISKKLFNKTIFKKKLSDLTVDEFTQQFNELLTTGLEAFSKTVLEELKPSLPSEQLEKPLETTIGKVTNTLKQIESKNDDILALVEKALETKQEFIPDQCLNFTWYNNLRKEINYANQHNLQLVEPIQEQLSEFYKNFEQIIEKLTIIEKLVELGFKANQEGQEKIYKTFLKLQRELQQEFKNNRISEARLLKLSALHLGDHKNFYSEGDITFQDTNYIERIDHETNTTIETIVDMFIKQNPKAENNKQLFLLLGEAGMGKTWLLTKIALKYITQNYPIFFITLRDGIEQKLAQIFNLKERSQVDYQLIESQKNLSKWLIIIFDGYDEIQYESDKRTLINGYLNLLQNQLKNTLIIISSRRFDWLNDEFTVNGKSVNVTNNIWPNAKKQHSYYLKKFTEQERISAFNQYKSQKIPELNTWNNELFELSFIPVWMRLICEIYKKGDTPTFKSTKLYTAYFDRVSLRTKHYELIGEISELFLEKEQRFGEEFSTKTKDFKNHAKQIQELHSKNILMESKERNQRIAKNKLVSPHFGYYGLAYQLYSKIHDLKEAKINKRASERKLFQNFVIKLDNLEPHQVKTVSTLASQITKEHGDEYDIKSIIEEIRKTSTNEPIKGPQIYTPPQQPLTIPTRQQKISITQIIAAIQRIGKTQTSKNIPLLRIARRLNITLEELRTPLEDAIFEERIKGAIDDQETIDENDDVLRLDENWNIAQIIQDKLNKAKILLQAKEVENLDKVKKILQELEAYKLQKEEINTKQQLSKEINEIVIQDKFSKINNLLSNPTLQKSEQAREILQSLQQDKLSKNHQITLQEFSEKIEAQTTTLKFQKISTYLVNPTLSKLNQANSKLLELKDSELSQEERVTKQKLLQTISTEHGKIQERNREISSAKQEITQLAENGQPVNVKIQTLKNKHKKHLTEHDLEFLKKHEVEDYYGVSLQAKEKIVLSQLEQMFGKQIPLVEEVGSGTFGYKNTGTTITSLGLYNQGLSSLPESISSFHNLRELYLYNNQLSSLPESISSLHKLQRLELQNNALSSLPENLGSLHKLQRLGLNNNQLSSLPESLSSLQELRILSLSDNALSSLPESISSLQELRVLSLGDNALSSLPESISSLQNLRELHLDWNQLSSLPESLGSLHNLRELYLYKNQLSSLPESISSLHNLRELYLHNNQLSSLPESIFSLHKLQILDLDNNQLSSLPESIFSLHNLRELRLGSNALSSLPENVEDALKKLEKNGCQISR